MSGWRQQRRMRRVKPGDGSALPRLHWWQLFGVRSVFHLDLDTPTGRRRYTVDVPTDSESGARVARLYVDGRQEARSRTPATFEVPGGVVDVVASAFGLKRCHYVSDGAEHQLTPDPRSLEGRRARLERRLPTVSRAIAGLSVLLLLVGLALLGLQVAEPISRIPPIADNLGTFTSPIQLTWWQNTLLTLGAAFGAMERATRLRYHWLLDAVGT